MRAIEYNGSIHWLLNQKEKEDFDKVLSKFEELIKHAKKSTV